MEAALNSMMVVKQVEGRLASMNVFAKLESLIVKPVFYVPGQPIRERRSSRANIVQSWLSSMAC